MEPMLYLVLLVVCWFGSFVGIRLCRVLKQLNLLPQ